MLGGYMGRILWVDLTTEQIWEEKLDEQMARDFIGGYGLGARILYEKMRPHVDPLGPDNILGFVTGVLTGTPAMEGNRFMVVCKSPLTGTWGDSNCGGHFGPALKRAGFDAVFFTGIAQHPVYLHINNGKPELVTAHDLWEQKDTVDTDLILKHRHGADAQVACIGLAGERKSLIAGIINDGGRAAGRSGVGAVMGSKKLKALVVQGNQTVPLADPEQAMALRVKYMAAPEQNTFTFFHTTGTIGDLNGALVRGDSPVKNWSSNMTQFKKGVAAFEPDKVMSYWTEQYGCWSCTLDCGGKMAVREGPYKSAGHKVEYETGAAFGTMALNHNFQSIVLCNDLCNRYGFDSISAGCTVAFAIECYEHGLLPQAQKEKLELHWGNHEAIVKLLRLMGERAGLGRHFADGVQKAAEWIGPKAHEFAIHIHGQEIPMHDPKFEPGLAVTYVMDATPGRHTQGSEGAVPPGLGLQTPDRTQQSGRGDLHKQCVCYSHVTEAAGICNFGMGAYDYHCVPELLTAVTGDPWYLHRCLLAGERIAVIRHLFNLREGLNPLEWEVPGRLLGDPPQTEGPNAGIVVDLKLMIQDYLQAMNWDSKTTVPAMERLIALGLDELVEKYSSDPTLLPA